MSAEKNPPEATGGPEDQQGGGSTSSVPGRDSIAQQLRRRRLASYRLPPLPCGHRDPLLDCRGRC